MIIYNILSFILSILVFIGLIYLIKISDPESKMYILSKKQKIIYTSFLLIQQVVLYFRFSNIIDTLFFSAFLTIMLVHAHTDFHTKYVYRLFSYIIWILGIIYSYLKVNVLHDITKAELPAFFGTSLLFILIMLIGSVFTGFIHGKGDGYILVGNAIFVQFLVFSEPKWGIEPILWHYIFSAIYLILFNIKKLNIKKFKMRERVPFAPAMYLASLTVTLLTGMPIVVNYINKIII